MACLTFRPVDSVSSAKLIALVGNHFDPGLELCGAVVSIRHNEDIISLWNKNSDDHEKNILIRCYYLFSFSSPA